MRFEQGDRVVSPACPFSYIGGSRVGVIKNQPWHDIKTVDYGWIDGVGHVVLHTHESHLELASVVPPSQE